MTNQKRSVKVRLRVARVVEIADREETVVVVVVAHGHLAVIETVDVIDVVLARRHVRRHQKHHHRRRHLKTPPITIKYCLLQVSDNQIRSVDFKTM